MAILFRESREKELLAISSRDVDKRRLKSAHAGVQGKLLAELPSDLPLYAEPLVPAEIVTLTEDGAFAAPYPI